MNRTPGKNSGFSLFSTILFFVVGYIFLGGNLTQVQAKEACNTEQLIFSCDQNIGFTGPTGRFQTFELEAASNFRYKLVIEIDGVGTYSCTFRNGVSLKRSGAITVCDLNDDGFKDIKILGGVDKCGNSWYKNWLYNPATQSFEEQK